MTSYYTPPKFGEKSPFELAMTRAMKKRSISSEDKDAVKKKRLFMEAEGSSLQVPNTQVWRMEKDSVSEKNCARDLKARDETVDDEGAGGATPLVVADETPSVGHNPDPMEIDTRYA
jgi:hypothetical protein